ncbi:MAG: glycerol kinase GlpK [Anaerolineae bacterium]|nr:glycerol kinase GlpK [Anaerolineae bacterium]
MRTVLAIDQSTSATKALLFRTDGTIIQGTSAQHRQFYPRQGWVEHDAEEIYTNLLAVVKALLARTGPLAGDIACLSITNQRETIVVFDRATGQPLHRAIVWQCRRGDPFCRRLIEAGHDETVRKKTGLKIDTYFPAPKLMWLLEHEPQIRRKLLAGEALIGTIDAYLIYRLTHGRVFACDYTNASRTLLFDIGSLRWSEELCHLFGVPVYALPEVRASNARFGETDLDGLLDTPIPICGVMGDSQAALFSERCFSPGTAKVTFGTGSSILLNTGAAVLPSAVGNLTTIAWVLDDQPTYAYEGIINCTGATVAWLRDQLALISSPEETETLARSLADNEGVYFVPAFFGLSAPYWRADAKAAIVGLTPSSTRNHVVRAALESIAYQVKEVLDVMGREADIPLQVLHADGGAVRNRFLMQFVADITRLTVRASSMPELSALGAALAGALGMGIYGSLQEVADLPLASTDYRPSMDASQAERYYAGWKAAVQRVL